MFIQGAGGTWNKDQKPFIRLGCGLLECMPRVREVLGVSPPSPPHTMGHVEETKEACVSLRVSNGFCLFVVFSFSVVMLLLNFSSKGQGAELPRP